MRKAAAMRARAAWLVAALALAPACDARRAKRSRPAPAQAATQVHLGEWFASGSGRCQVSGADQRLTESASLPFPGARVKPDVAALDLSLVCENGLGGPARSREVLPLDALALLRDPAGRKHAARGADESARDHPEGARDHLLFELPEGETSSIAAPRRFDAATGQASVPREQAVGSLEVRAPSLAVDVLLRPRFFGASFDAFLDELAKGLARGAAPVGLAADERGADAVRALSALYTEVQGQFEAARFELVSALPVRADVAAEVVGAGAGASPSTTTTTTTTTMRAARGGEEKTREPEELLAVFALSRPRRSAAGGEIARFELRLARDQRGWRVADFENREAARQALDCGELDANLETRLARAHAADARPATRERGEASGDSCNVLGLLVPGSCARADRELVERALMVRARCHVPRAPDEQRAPPLPEDFQISLRRGRPERGLDRNPRYLLTVFATGQVIFHGHHWVNTQERSDGRTARALVAGLYARLLKLDWFSRRADSAARACSQSEQGDLISVHANGRERVVVDREGCRDPFNEVELSELKRRLELIAGVQGWISPRPGYADDKVEHWTLADKQGD
jgi:hypothetical protein